LPIDSEHPEYIKRKIEWRDCRVSAGGWRRVKSAGTDYLPLLGPEQDGTDYADYLKRAYFLEAFGRTKAALVGAVMQKPPAVEMQPEDNLRLHAWLDNVSGEGVGVDMLAETVLDSMLEVSRLGLYVTIAAEDSLAPEPYCVQYAAEAIINWRAKGNGAPLLVVLYENVLEPAADDPYSLEGIDQWRELRLGGPGLITDHQAGEIAPEHRLKTYPDDVFIVNVWRRQTSGDDRESFEIIETHVPEAAGRPLDYIPFVFVNASTLSVEPQRPAYTGLVEALFDHYRLMADYRHGLSITALPTPYFFGEGATKGTLTIGSRAAWTSDEADAKAGMIEYTGQGLNALRDAIADAEKTAAFLGARLLSASTSQVEAAETHRIRQQSEQVSIVEIAATASEAITQVVRLAIRWMGMDTTSYRYRLNTDVTNTRLTAPEVTALLQAYQAGGMSFSTFYYNLQQGEIARPGVDAVSEQEEIELAGVA